MHAEEMVKVKVGALECNPLESEEIIDIKILSDQVEKLEEGLNATNIEYSTDISRLEDKLDATITKVEEHKEVFLKVKKTVGGCPTEDRNYNLIDGRCYYLSLDRMTYENAKSLCAAKFVGGKLFEPEDVAKNNFVWNAFYDLHSSASTDDIWIGVNEKNSENNFQYDSSGLQITFNSPWGYGSGNRHANSCVLIGSDGLWYDYICSSTRRFLCEQ